MCKQNYKRLSNKNPEMRQQLFELEECVSIASTLKLCDQNWLKDIFVYQESMKAKREKDRENNRKVISALYKSIKEISVDIHDSKKLQNIDINQLRAKLKNIQERIETFKTQNELYFKKLQEEEKSLASEIENFDRELSSFEKTERVKIHHLPNHNHVESHSVLEDQNEDVTRFENFLLDNGGHFGGWEEEDHLLYLQFHKKYKVKSLFVEALQVRLPGLSDRDILEHEKWYADYLFLREKQRRAIRKWRTQKEEEKAKQRSNALKVTGPKIKVDVQSFLEKKQKLDEWKLKRLEKKRLEEEAAQKMRREYMEKAFERKQLQDMKRVAVEIYKKEKMCQQNSHLLMKQLKELKEREERAAQANMLLKAFRQNDETYIERKRLSRVRQMKKNENKSNRLEEARQRVGVVAERDPSRLLRPTLSWQDRLQSKNSDSSNKPILHLRNMPRLGVPSWRKALVS